MNICDDCDPDDALLPDDDELITDDAMLTGQKKAEADYRTYRQQQIIQ